MAALVVEVEVGVLSELPQVGQARPSSLAFWGCPNPPDHLSGVWSSKGGGLPLPLLGSPPWSSKRLTHAELGFFRFRLRNPRKTGGGGDVSESPKTPKWEGQNTVVITGGKPHKTGCGRRLDQQTPCKARV